MGSKIIEAFDQYAEDYDKWFDSAEGKVPFEMEAGAVRLLMKGLTKPFLEVGVGTGRFAKELGIDFGIDPSHKVLDIAKRRGIKVEEAKGEKLPFKDESFGAVFLLFTLCFMKNPERVFSEAERVLKRGGGLIIGLINRKSPWGKLYVKKKAEGHPIYKYAKFYSVNEVVKMLKMADMSVEAYSSTLWQPPSDEPNKEDAHNKLIEEAGFICILAKKF